MGQYKLVADPHATNPARVQAWVSRFNSLPGAQIFLNIPGKPGGNITITDNPTSSSLAPGNQAKIARLLNEGLHGLNQQAGGTNVEFLNPNAPDGKDPVNVLAHEIGHMKWPGLGTENKHDPLFYRLLNDSLMALTLPVDKQLDLNGVDIDDVASPAGSDPLRYNITPSVRSPLAAPLPRSSIGPSPQAVPPGGNPPAAAPPSNIVPLPPRVLQSPRNSGQPLDIRPPAQSGTQGPVGTAPSPGPPLPPLHFAPEPPQDFGPFTLGPQPTSGSDTPAINGVAGDGASSPFPATPGLDQSSPDTRSKKPMRYLSGRVVGAPWAWAFDAGAPAVPFVVTDNPLAPAPPASFNDRFGSFASSPPPAAQQPAQSDGSARPDPKPIRVLSSRFPELNPGGVALGNPPSPGAPNPSSVQNGWPPATQPLPDFPVPPSVYGLPDPSAGSMDDWFDRWIKPLFER